MRISNRMMSNDVPLSRGPTVIADQLLVGSFVASACTTCTCTIVADCRLLLLPACGLCGLCEELEVGAVWKGAISFCDL